MMVLHPGSATETKVAGRPAMQRTFRRRRSSKGTIAGFAFGKSDPVGSTPVETLSGNDLNESSNGVQVNTSGPGSPSQPQHNAESSALPAKPCHAARLALMCAHNAVKLGARTHLYLCPPGRARRELQAYLRQKARERVSPPSGKLGVAPEVGGYYGLDKLVGPNSVEEYENQEEDFLISTNTFDVDSEEEVSSGDEDDLEDFNDLFSEDPIPITEDKYSNLREPLYTPSGSESSNPNGAPMLSGGTGGFGKLPFNRRKIRFFDLISAGDKKIAREYLQNEMRRSKTRASLTLSRHLRRVQKEELRRKRELEGHPVDDLADSEDGESPEEKALMAGVKQIQVTMNSAVASALLMESLSVGTVESLEGMGKCYDGIVNAGVALLEAQSVDPTKPPSSDDKVRATRSEIVTALAPLLVTSLEQPSGEVILLLAKLRRMCGTKRYQRRFVQRVAPNLVRPPRGAMWCLRHQNDMEAIFAACELIFDSAFEIFSKGWYERGRLMLADSKRAETLDFAAKQLRNLSSEPSDGLIRALSSGPRRRIVGGVKMKPDGKGTSEPLAEWEVIAVDRQIRLSISHVLLHDWSRATFYQETSRIMGRRGGAASRRTNSVLPSQSSEMSPKAVTSSPQRGVAGLPVRTPHSPPQMPPAGPAQPTPESMENVFGPSFASQNFAQSAERSQSPPPSSPPLPSRNVPRDYLDGRSQQEENASVLLLDRSSAQMHAPPPLSPRSPMNESEFGTDPGIPRASSSRPRDPSVASSAGLAESAAHFSPSSIMGSSSFSEMASFKVSGAPSSSSTTIPALQYRTLTSSAAERKRTVAACRALRAQIQRFEDAFIQLHGRPPKGASERAPLATTYAQYREWKRAIRADAACRIQALLRGALTRLLLLRSGDSELTHVVLRRAGRPGSSPDLALPADIGRVDDEHVFSGTSSAESGLGRNGSSSLSPQWTSRQLRSRISSEDRSLSDLVTSGTGSLAGLSTQSKASAAGVPGEFAGFSLRELQARKRDLKQQLKQYDMNFARRHGRMPVKAEKEPIRHLYESYNALKSQITLMEQEGKHLPSSGVAGAPMSSGSSRALTSLPSPESNDDSLARDAQLRNKRKMPRQESPPVSSSMTASTFSQDLAALKAEKQDLHQMLRTYEKDFFKKHKRQVSSFADIKPVAPQYRRYKEIKKAISALQKEK